MSYLFTIHNVKNVFELRVRENVSLKYAQTLKTQNRTELQTSSFQPCRYNNRRMDIKEPIMLTR